MKTARLITQRSKEVTQSVSGSNTAGSLAGANEPKIQPTQEWPDDVDVKPENAVKKQAEAKSTPANGESPKEQILAEDPSNLQQL
ncbi:hypothetical protein Aduo_004454 [Ancylostoma duodenale]